MVQQFVHWPDDYRIWSHYDQIDIPVVCLHGVESDLVLPATLAQMQARGPGLKGLLEVVDVPGCGHPPALNVPDQLNRVSDFISRVGR